MVLTRATVSAGEDGVMGTADDVGPVNTTTPFVDQNQTYTSHSSHQVFLRQYALDDSGQPVATGKLIQGQGGGMATWADVKAQARDLLGIDLTDADVGSVPLLAADEYGNFIPGENGLPQVVFPGINPGDPPILVEGNLGSPISTEGAVRTGHAFLADIAHTAVPLNKLADGDIEIGLLNFEGDPEDPNFVYDNELLDAHFIAGDGRANENIGLTAVHHVFHSEHNRLVEHTKDVVLQTGDIDFINEWLSAPIVELPNTPEEVSALSWDGERLFQAAKFGTEMQYQHLVFEEFARKVSPSINAFLVPDGFDTTLDPSIVGEFAHVVYRFGHSMLTESIDRFDTEFQSDHISLIDGFLNPIAFNSDGTVSDDVAAGAIVRGMTRQIGNEIDEFVTGALQNNLLGLPLDLATINLARGRDTGVPSLNAARREFYQMTNNADELKPYESWVEFASNIKNPSSIINFIAAYGTHDLIASQTTLEGKRAAAIAIVMGVEQTVVGDPNDLNDDVVIEVPVDAEDFLNSTGEWASGEGGVTTTGLDNVDLWIGGLAERIMPFGGMLGSTFAFVFEVQMENLQSGDRFYYLQRLDGLHLFGEMENNSFASMIMRNTNATHLPSDVFSAPGLILEVDQERQFTGLGVDGKADPDGGTILVPEVIRDHAATPGADTNYLRYTGGEHVVLGGTDPGNAFNPSGDDIIIAGIGDDTLYGDAGNDRLRGGLGNDIINGGDGDDIIRDSGGDDNIKAGTGNDVVHAGPGLDLVLAGAGSDFVVLGTDEGSEVFGGEGNDFILGNKNAERILGNEGDDWLETGTFDGAPGDNFDEIFARDGINGHDVFLGDGGFDEFIGEGGDDIMVGSLGTGKLVGMSGFDWATYKDMDEGYNADLLRLAFDENPIPPVNAGLETYEAIEGLSGSAHDDILSGDDVDSTTIGLEGFLGSVLTSEGITLIDGLQELLGAGVTSFDSGNIILGGDGDDVIEGRGGDDLLDGDKWLNVRISVRDPLDSSIEIGSHDSMRTLMSSMFDGSVNPGQLQIVREVLQANAGGDIDTAVFSGNFDEYTIGTDGLGRLTVAHTGGTQVDGTDTLTGFERLQFADQIVVLPGNATGAPDISDMTPTEGQILTASIGTVSDGDGTTTSVFSYAWEVFDNGVWTSIPGATEATFTPTDDQVNMQLRVVVSFTDDQGNAESLSSAPSSVVGDLFTGTPGADIFDGTDGDDVADGLGGDDTLNGNAGNDVLAGSGGADTLDGGDGVDTASYAGSAAGVKVDLLNGTAIGGDAAGDTFISIENVTGSASNDTLFGNALGNVLSGGNGHDVLAGRGGNDTLDGGAGDDTVNGGNGADTLIGGDGIDTLTTVTNGAAQKIDLLANTITGGDSTGDTISGFENVTTGSGNDLLLGSNDANVIVAGGGNDTLVGRGGNDTLDGGEGNDTVNGGNGTDVLIGGNGNDTLDTTSTGAAQAVDLEAQTITGGDSTGDTISGFENVRTGSGADLLSGNAVANVLDGGAGNDTLNGKDGADTLTGGDGQDSYAFDTALGAGNIDVITSFVVADDTIVLDDAIFTALPPGALAAGAFTTGAAAADADDRIIWNDVTNQLFYDEDGLGGVAAIQFATIGSVSGTLSAADFSVMSFGASESAWLDAAVGTDLVGDESGNTLQGFAGGDTIRGLGGNDTLLGGTGSDVLAGGAGADRLTGGAGSDVFEYNAIADSIGGGGRDAIADFETGIDLIGLSGIDANTMVDGDQAFTFIGSAGFSRTAGELRVATVGTGCVVRGDVNGDAVVDFSVFVSGHASLSLADFIL